MLVINLDMLRTGNVLIKKTGRNVTGLFSLNYGFIIFITLGKKMLNTK